MEHDTIASIAPATRATLVVGNLGETVSTRLSRDNHEVLVVEFEVCDATGRCRVVAVTKPAVQAMKKTSGAPVLLLDAAVQALPTRHNEACLRVTLPASASVIPLSGAHTHEALQEWADKHAMELHDLEEVVAAAQRSLPPVSPPQGVADRSFETYPR